MSSDDEDMDSDQGENVIDLENLDNEQLARVENVLLQYFHLLDQMRAPVYNSNLLDEEEVGEKLHLLKQELLVSVRLCCNDLEVFGLCLQCLIICLS